MNGTHKHARTALPPGGARFPLKGEPPAKLAAEHRELREALFAAAQIHRKLCSPREARRGAFEVAGEMFAVRHLSGDFLKVLDLGSTMGLVLGDIAGKGLSASLWVAHVLGLVGIYATERAELPAAMQSINRALCQALAEPPMVALFLARLDPCTGEMEYCNAGQPAALLLRNGEGDGEAPVTALSEGGPVLGALPDANFACGRVRLEPGDTLVACSDGVVETRGARDNEFGAERLSEAVRAASPGVAWCGAAEVLFSTLGAVLDFANGRPLEDDLTLMVARRRPNTVLRA